MKGYYLIKVCWEQFRLLVCRFLGCGCLRRAELHRLLQVVLGSLLLRLCVCRIVLILRMVLGHPFFDFSDDFLVF